MTQVRTPAGSGVDTGTGSEYIADATQLPTALVFDEIPGQVNAMGPGLVHYDITDGTLFSGTCETTSSDFVWKMTAADNGRIVGMTISNGGVALDGAVGWELDFINSDQSNVTCAFFGFGSGTEPDNSTDQVLAVAAGEVKHVSNSIVTEASHFDKGDVIQVTANRDGTTSVSTFTLLVSYESQGHV